MEFGTAEELKKLTEPEEHKVIDAVGQDLEKIMDALQRDKLTRDERVRLEALAQAVSLNSAVGKPNIAQVIDDADYFEKYIRGSD